MASYKKCPRCELNWIPVDEEYCDVCKLELHMKTDLILLEDDDQEDGQSMCPICKQNYILEDEDMCSACRLEQLEKEEVRPVEDEESEWTEIFDEPVDEDEEDSISIVDIEAEEDDVEDKWDDVNPDDEKFPDIEDELEDLGGIDDYDEEEDEDEDEDEDF